MSVEKRSSKPNPICKYKDGCSDCGGLYGKEKYKFFPEVILATNLTDGTKDFDEIGLFHESLQSGQTWNKSIGNFQFNISRHASKNILNQYDKKELIMRDRELQMQQ